MILAAGRGERLRPWTDTVPKPLLRVGGRRLIEHHLLGLATAGFSEVVINIAYMAEAIEQTLGDGSAYGLTIRYSHEQPGALDTGGGIRQALALLNTDSPFAVINADIVTDYPFSSLSGLASDPNVDAHIVLAPNPPHHPRGDFGLQENWLSRAAPLATFTGIGVYRPEVFARQTQARFGLAQVLYELIDAGRARGELYHGRWHDVGTAQAFAELGGAAG